MGEKCAIGIDFGTQSARVLVVETATGLECASVAQDYGHGVMDACLPDRATPLGVDWAIQHPGDYIEVLHELIAKALVAARVDVADVVGVGVDFTSCTVLPLDETGRPLCFSDEFAAVPHAYVKLWKHHAAQNEADALNRVARERGEGFLERLGGRVSSEALIPKIWQVLNEAPEVYERAHKFMEAGDWIVMQLTSQEKRSACMAGFKALWNPETGYPSREFFHALDPRLENVVQDKLGSTHYPIGAKAGEITAEAASLTGLNEGTAVAVACVDAHAALVGTGITEPGSMLLIMGTSSCHILLDSRRRVIPGICGMVEDGIIPGYYAYEAGQCCVGDNFEWFVRNCVPERYQAEATARGISIHQLLSEEAAKLEPGQSGVLALDWWNGNRSILADSDLSGLFIGCSLRTKPEELYRALIEATAYGTRMIIDNYRQHGIEIHEICAAGGIAMNNPVIMQIYADVLNATIRISSSAQTSALGAAILGAAAAGKAKGGHDSIAEAAHAMVDTRGRSYAPISEHVQVYDLLYREYRTLHDYFGRGGNEVMKRLKYIQAGIPFAARRS